MELTKYTLLTIKYTSWNKKIKSDCATCVHLAWQFCFDQWVGKLFYVQRNEGFQRDVWLTDDYFKDLEAGNANLLPFLIFNYKLQF